MTSDNAPKWTGTPRTDTLEDAADDGDGDEDAAEDDGAPAFAAKPAAPDDADGPDMDPGVDIPPLDAPLMDVMTGRGDEDKSVPGLGASQLASEPGRARSH